MKQPYLVAVMGPTASGKTRLAEEIADRLEAQLINADAFQVFRGLDIGTAKPIDKHRYLLVDILDPSEPFGLGAFVQLATDHLTRLYSEGRSAVIVGGTGLFVRGLLESYSDMAAAPDPELRTGLMQRLEMEGLEALAQELRKRSPELAARTDLANPARVRRALEKLDSPAVAARPLPDFARLKLVLELSPEVNAHRIEARLDEMTHLGWLHEVEILKNAGLPSSAPGLRAIGYREWYEYLDNIRSFEETRMLILTRSLQYAKRQRTWLRKEPNSRTINMLSGMPAMDLVIEWIT